MSTSASARTISDWRSRERAHSRLLLLAARVHLHVILEKPLAPAPPLGGGNVPLTSTCCCQADPFHAQRSPSGALPANPPNSNRFSPTAPTRSLTTRRRAGPGGLPPARAIPEPRVAEVPDAVVASEQEHVRSERRRRRLACDDGTAPPASAPRSGRAVEGPRIAEGDEAVRIAAEQATFPSMSGRRGAPSGGGDVEGVHRATRRAVEDQVSPGPPPLLTTLPRRWTISSPCRLRRRPADSGGPPSRRRIGRRDCDSDPRIRRRIASTDADQVDAVPLPEASVVRGKRPPSGESSSSRSSRRRNTASRSRSPSTPRCGGGRVRVAHDGPLGPLRAVPGPRVAEDGRPASMSPPVPP